MYKLILIILSLVLLHIMIKRSEKNEKVGCLLTLISVCIWLSTIFILYVDYAFSHSYEEQQEYITTASPPVDTTKSDEWYKAAGQKIPD